MPTFNELLQLVPVEEREQIKCFATDRGGVRAAFYSRPTRADGHWHTNQPYVIVSADPKDGAGWENSLIKKPSNAEWYFIGGLIATCLSAVAWASVHFS